MFIPFVSRKSKIDPAEQVMLALDIGTVYVKAVIFKIEDNEVHIKGYSKVKQQSNSMRGAMIVNIKKVIASCDMAVGEALNMADKIIGKQRGEDNYETPVPQSVVIGIAGEFVKGVAIVANYEREEPNEKITQSEINEVVESVKEQSFEGVLDEISQEIGIDPSNIEEINTVINSIYIDGHKVDDPENFTGTEVAYRVYTTFAPSIHINSLKEVVSSLDLELHSIQVEPYTVARALKGARDEKFSAVVIDIGGGTTDIALINNGGMIGTKMFAFGGNVFTKRIENDFKLEYEKAEEMKLNYSKLTLSETMSEKVKSAFSKDIPVWIEGVELALADFEDIKNYPGDILLCGGGSELIDIKEGLIQHPWLNVLPFQKYPRTTHIFPNQLENLVDDTKTMSEPSDIAPAALALSVLE